jgi:hypothetical protein
MNGLKNPAVSSGLNQFVYTFDTLILNPNILTLHYFKGFIGYHYIMILAYIIQSDADIKMSSLFLFSKYLEKLKSNTCAHLYMQR